MPEKNKYVIAVLSLDRVGIISNVTGTILQLGGNIDKMSQTVMDGCFTILITAVFPRRCTADSIRAEIEARGSHLDLTVGVRLYAEPRTPAAHKTNIYFLTMTARDRKGVVHEITNCLASHGVNIVDLYCFLKGQGEFVLIGEIDVPADCDLAQVQIDLETIDASRALSVRIQHENLFLATNDLYLTRQEHII
jgi:glycine cleavage system transcriptional repressor